MLVKQLIHETLELQGFCIASVEKKDSGIVVTIEPDLRYHPRCGVCGLSGDYRDTLPERYFRHVPLWGIDVHLVYSPCRVRCSHCGGIHVERIPWSAGKRRFTKALAITIATWARQLTWHQVSLLFGCSWGTVAAAVDYAVSYGLARRDLSEITHIGIDEISRQKGHIYLTNVYNLKTGTLIWSAEGRSTESLDAFFTFFGEERTKQLKGICCDMWPAFIKAVKAKAPQATLVFDKFHIVKKITEAVDTVRRQEISEKGQEYKKLLAGSKYLWLKNPWNLTDRQKSSLSFLETLNLTIHRAYLLKESFRDFWQSATKDLATKFISHWCSMANESKIKPMEDVAKLLRRHETNIVTYFDMPISNGIVEGLNNKAKVISHRAYGFRTAKNFITNLYHCMGDLPMPTTLHRFV
jgi:transposase